MSIGPIPRDPPLGVCPSMWLPTGVKGRLLVPVDCGSFTGANILKVARNQLRLFSGALADTTATYALTEQQIFKLRSDYQPDVFLR